MTPETSLRIEQIEIMPLDTLPSLRRVISTGPIAYGKDNLVGRSVLIAVRAGGITGYGQMRPVNPFQGETAASVVATLRDCLASQTVRVETVAGREGQNRPTESINRPGHRVGWVGA